MPFSIPLGAVVPLVYLVAAVALCSWLFWHRRPRMPYKRMPDLLVGPAMPGDEEADNAALDAAEFDETGMVRPAADRLRTPPVVLGDAEEAARHVVEREALAHRAQANALFHP
jgi:hypothetical protein